jgi:hypothetical protein
MKNSILTFILLSLTISLTMIVSCEKGKDDNNSTNKKNEYTIDGVTKEIRWIGISPEFLNDVDGEYVINILPTLPTGDIGLFGSPEYIYLETKVRLNGQNIDLINVTSNYAWDFEYENPTYVLEGICSNNTIEGDISGGTLSINRLDLGYLFEISFNISFKNGKTLKGYYKGTLKIGDIDTPFSTWQ